MLKKLNTATLQYICFAQACRELPLQEIELDILYLPFSFEIQFQNKIDTHAEAAFG